MDADAKPKRTRRKKAVEPVAAEVAPADESSATMDVPVSETPPAKPKRTRKPKAAATEAVSDAAAPAVAVPDAAPAAETAPVADSDGGVDVDSGQAAAGAIDPDPGEAGSPRRGWWQRTFGA